MLQNAVSDQGLRCLLIEISIKINYSLNIHKETPTNRNGLIQMIRVIESKYENSQEQAHFNPRSQQRHYVGKDNTVELEWLEDLWNR